MKFQSTVLAMAMAFGMISGACSSGSGKPSGAGGGADNGAGGAASCSDVVPCGGNVVGTWTVTSSCLKVAGDVDISGFGLGCVSASVTGSLQVTGTWTANADGTYSDNTTTSGDEQITLPPSCLNVSGTTTTCERIGGPIQALGYASVTCTSAASGGCTCAAVVQQTGGLGLLSVDPSTSGGYTTPSNVLTTDSGPQYPYCVSGNKMTLTPQSPTTTGTVAFQSGGTTSTGGTTGTTGTGGTTSTGGISGAGGRTSTGGTTGGTGGSTGQGGSAATGGRTGAGGATGSTGGAGGGSTGIAQGPCDIYATGSTPCVAAYSTVRLLASKYTGPLYQVRKGGLKTGSGGTTQDIGTIAGGFADGAAQDTFCGTDTCTVSKLYDQSGKANHLLVAPAGCYMGTASQPDNESNAKGRSLTVSGHKAYALFMVAQDGYRNDSTSGMPTGSAAQGIYEVADGKRGGPACCSDFGNAKTNNCNGPTGSMNAMFFGTGFWGKGAGSGPWFMGDFEAGVWAGGSGASTIVNSSLPASNMDYAFGVLKTNSTGYAIRVGDAQSGSLTTGYDGAAPAAWTMQGAIVLGIGGDNSNSSLGTFFEGAITAGRPSDATDAAVLQNVQAAGYGK
jgi:hypothetical protein